jgi:hypothetical protein
MESVGITMLDSLIPGITNITKHARYYSLHAWLLKHFWETSDDHSEKAFRKFRRPIEMAFALAFCLHHGGEGDGLTGIDQVNVLSPLWSSDRKEFDLDPDKHNFRSSEWIYHSVMRQLKIVEDDRDDDRLVGSLVMPLGRDLAEEFERNITGTEFYAILKKKGAPGKISRAALLELAERACLCQLAPHGGRERDVLQQAFFRFDLKGTDHPARFGNRRKTLLFFLDMVRQRAGEEFGLRDFEDLAYFWKYDKQVGYKPPAALEDIAELWRLFWSRQHLVYSILSYFSYMLHDTRGRTTSLNSFIDETVSGMELEKVAKELSIGAKTFDPRKLLVRDLISAIQKSVGAKDKGPQDGVEFDRLCGHGSPVSESLLTDAIDDAPARTPRAYVTRATLCLLSVFVRMRPYLKTPFADFLCIGEEGDNYRVSTASFFQELEARLPSADFTVERFVRWVFEDYVISQHLRVAFAKWQTGNDTFSFIQDGETIRGIDDVSPQFNNMRFYEITTMLADLGLIAEKPDGAFALTARGTKALENGEDFYGA